LSDEIQTKGKTISKNGILKQPLIIALSFFLIALVFRLIDIFVLNLDYTNLNILTSKVIPLVLLLVYLRWNHRRATALGIHRLMLLKNTILGFLVFAVIWTLPVALEFMALPLRGIIPSIGIQLMDSFSFTYLIGFYIVNSFMEEGLFRGLMMRCFMTRISVFRANLLQSFFFSLWHLVWPVKVLVTGSMLPAEALSYAIYYLAVTFIFGFTAGFMFQNTSSLAGPIVLHTVWNLFARTTFIMYIVLVPNPPWTLLLSITIAEEAIRLVAAILVIRVIDYILKMPKLTSWDKPIIESTKPLYSL
jgi:membrane protease YdiL (CAAX protease family)